MMSDDSLDGTVFMISDFKSSVNSLFFVFPPRNFLVQECRCPVRCLGLL